MGILNLFIDKNAHVQVVPFLFFFLFFAFLCTLPLLSLFFFLGYRRDSCFVLFCFFFLFFLFCLTRHDFFGYDFYFLINLDDCFFLGGLFTTFLF